MKVNVVKITNYTHSHVHTSTDLYVRSRLNVPKHVCIHSLKDLSVKMIEQTRTLS